MAIAHILRGETAWGEALLLAEIDNKYYFAHILGDDRFGFSSYEIGNEVGEYLLPTKETHSVQVSYSSPRWVQL